MSDRHEITIVGREGGETEIPWVKPQSLMEAIRDNDLPISAECGGFASCATCHVHLDPVSYARFPEPQQDELDMLDGEEKYEPGVSRLACQIAFDPAVDTLTAQLASPPVDF